MNVERLEPFGECRVRFSGQLLGAGGASGAGRQPLSLATCCARPVLYHTIAERQFNAALSKRKQTRVSVGVARMPESFHSNLPIFFPQGVGVQAPVKDDCIDAVTAKPTLKESVGGLRGPCGWEVGYIGVHAPHRMATLMPSSVAAALAAHDEVFQVCQPPSNSHPPPVHPSPFNSHPPTATLQPSPSNRHPPTVENAPCNLH